MPDSSVPDAALATLLSLSAADALGAATEFKTPDAIQARYGVIDSYQPGSVFGFLPGEATDDSQMVAATLLGYARGTGHVGVLDALREWQAAGPPDVGALTGSALRQGPAAADRLGGGARAWQASGHQSAGNGGLMRIAAVWLAGFRGEALARESAVVTALTHADPRCVHASVFFTTFMEALDSGQLYAEAAARGLEVMAGLDARSVLLDAGVLGINLRETFGAFGSQDREARAQVRARVRSGLAGHVTSQSGYVLDTLEAAVAHASAEDWL
ncbi:ADP-ribosylglycohydrolase family protein, partial [Deinococcus sp.]|uniref:ADP-ribosylglycohydrolase family protein n=1 Tax=Deinococcus sp. TaxID=47478 RepID=UPI002869CD00